MKIGLVLEGGAMRATYTIGVLDVLMENNIEFDGIIGVSAGAVHGASYVAKQPGRNIRYYKKYSSDKRFMSLYSLITTGDMVGKDFCYNDIPWKLDPFDNDTFKNSKTEFYVVAANVETGESEYIRVKLDTENYRARRKDTLENLAKNIAFKVKRTRRTFTLEPMNPYERRIIHSALQGNKYVETMSEGEEPYRHVVVKLKKYQA